MKKIIYSLCIVLGISTASFAQTESENKEYRETGDPSKIVTGASSLPDPVRQTLDDKFAGSFVVTFRENQPAEMKKEPYYEIELRKDDRTFMVYIERDGEFMRKEEMKADAK